jgi:hypothetical protein
MNRLPFRKVSACVARFDHSVISLRLRRASYRLLNLYFDITRPKLNSFSARVCSTCFYGLLRA